LDSGKITGVDCNDLSPAQADSKGKFQKAQQKLRDSITKACTDAGASATVLDKFVSCPDPCGSSVPIPNPMASYTDVGNCLACLAGDIVSRANTVEMDSPTGLTDDEAKCHGAIAKGYGKHLSTLVKERQGCQKNEDKGGNNTLTTCSTYDGKSKIASAVTKAEDGLDSSCASVALSN